jgi:hypothetical protein
MGIPAGRRLYSYPTHDLTGRIWILPMDTKVCPYPAGIRRVLVPIGKIVIPTKSTCTLKPCTSRVFEEIERGLFHIPKFLR